jgi:DNA helicase-2/ATP-dependent DNA helicase PcrA
MITTASGSAEHIFADLEFSIDFDVREEILKELDAGLSGSSVDLREALREYAPNADAFQRRVIESTASTIRIVAPAGSGKTQTVVNRVLHRVKEGLNPARILVLTFDNSAAASLKTKLREQMDRLGVELGATRIATLNAFGYSVLREHVPEEYRSIISSQRAYRLVREVLDALKAKSPERYQTLPTDVKDRVYLDLFSLFKNEVLDPRAPDAQKIADYVLRGPSAAAFVGDRKDPDHIRLLIQALVWLFQAYERAMQREELVDFDDQKLRAHIRLRETPAVLRRVQDQFSEVIVDEFQDINRLDFEFVRSVAAKATLVVTGDDDQAIYGFRGCSPDFIIDLETHLGRSVTSFELQTNYRNPRNIVARASELIVRNTRRIAKNPIAQRQDDARIKVLASGSAGLEARCVTAYVRRLRRSNPTLKWDDFAVLYRTNAQSLPLQVELLLNDIPYYVREQDDILKNEILERLLGFLRLKIAMNAGMRPAPADAFLTMQAYFKYIPATARHQVERIAARADNVLEAFQSPEMYRVLAWVEQSHLAMAVAEAVAATTLLDTLDVIAKRFKGIRGMLGSLEDVADERVPMGEIYEIAANFRGNTRSFVSMIDEALRRAREAASQREGRSGVALLTYFKSKGLQWHTVVLTTCNEGLIPHSRAPIEDERRLFYVAMTRASSNLLISYVKKSCGNSVVPSRFLAEANLLQK